jgi:hypothetical protein
LTKKREAVIYVEMQGLPVSTSSRSPCNFEKLRISEFEKKAQYEKEIWKKAGSRG